MSTKLPDLQQSISNSAGSKGVGNYRWYICALLFFATTVNYLDRQVLSLLKPRLEEEFGWSNTDYAISQRHFNSPMPSVVWSHN